MTSIEAVDGLLGTHTVRQSNPSIMHKYHFVYHMFRYVQLTSKSRFKLYGTPHETFPYFAFLL